MATTFERSALYEEVWTAPLTTLGRKYGLSDNGLRKICKALNIPLPHAGHWAKVAAGHTVARTPLPAQADRTSFTSNPPGKATAFKLPDDADWLTDREAFELQPQNKIAVRMNPQRWHAAVAPLRTALIQAAGDAVRWKREHEKQESRSAKQKSSEPDWSAYKWRMFLHNGQILCHTHHSSAMRVTPGTYERALAIMNELCIAAEHRGSSIRLHQDHGRFEISLEHATFEIAIREKLQDQWYDEVQSWSRKTVSVKRKEPTGVLNLTLGRRGYSSIQVSDTSEDPLESQLNTFFVRLYRGVVRARETHRVNEDKRNKYDAEQLVLKELTRQREEAARIKADEAARKKDLLMEADRWHQAEQIRRYVENLNAQSSEMSEHETGKEQFRIWCDWALQVAKELDPSNTRQKVGQHALPL